MRDLVTVIKALADENRIRAVLALARRELCACQLVELLQLAPSTVSKHMFILKSANLVESRKDGRWIYYHLAADERSTAATSAIAWLCGALGGSRQAREDARRLRAIVKMDAEALCRRQRAEQRGGR